MNRITNTSENEARLDWLFGGNPNAIEAQEAKGQTELLNSSQLPVDGNYSFRNFEDLKAQYEKMGIKVLNVSERDPIFTDVILPEGWSKRGTEHSMWSELIDAKGNVRAMIFYKAAFYDRSSHIDFRSRYVARSVYPEKGNFSVSYYAVVDTVTDTELFKIDRYMDDNSRVDDEKFALCKSYLNENFPEWQDVNAYWED